VPDGASQLERLKSTLANRYTIERELGHGGMATVYLAEDLKHRRKVALKALKPELAAVLGRASGKDSTRSSPVAD
jgi:serine/threonine-protein kinase